MLCISCGVCRGKLLAYIWTDPDSLGFSVVGMFISYYYYYYYYCVMFQVLLLLLLLFHGNRSEENFHEKSHKSHQNGAEFLISQEATSQNAFKQVMLK